MPADKALPLDGIPEAPHPTESLTAVRADVQTQLSSPKDISAATNFFKPQGAESFLPSMPTPSGMEAAALTPAGLPMPGAEQMSPLVNMIMKMPGHLSLASSFFEFLGSFFGGGDMLSMLDPITGQIMDGLGSLGEHLGIDLNLLPDDGGVTILGDSSTLETLNNKNLLSFNSSEPLDGPGQSLDYGFAHAPDLNVNGGAPFGKPLFETGQETNLNFAPAGGGENLLAMDPGGGFGSSVGPTSGQPVDPQNLPTQPNQLPANQNFTNTQTQAGAGLERGVSGQADGAGASQTLDSNGNQITTDQNAASAADSPETTSYTVKDGDNLWDLAGKHMGDSTKWGEIYKLNEGVIGNNPRLIMPGTELQLPGAGGLDGQSLAQDYTVKSGDNLWNISKDNLGGGEHWKDLYSNNSDVVGSNPNMIHPGQHLNMNAAGHGAAGGSHLASNHAGHAASHGTHSNVHTAAHSVGHNAGHTGGNHIANSHNQHLSSNHGGTAHGAAQGDIAKVSSTPVELKAVAKSLPGIEIYKDAASTNPSDLGT